MEPWKTCGYPSEADLKPMHSNLLVWAKEQKTLPCINGEYSELPIKKFRDLEKSVWTVVPSRMHKTSHVCPFPISLAERVVRFWSHKNDVVLDIFGGSGSTAMACVRNQRKFIHIDASETYCQEAQESIDNEMKKYSRSIINAAA